MKKITDKSGLARKIKPLGVAIGVVSAMAASYSNGSEFTLEEVVVTAQKRVQSLQDIPMSVAAVDDGALKNAGISSLGEVQQLVPALRFSTIGEPAMSSIAIRGAGTGATDPTLEPSVGVFIDGVFMPRSVFGLSDLVDIDRVEVLLGPQGTLYGKNTNAGVVSVHSKGMPDGFEGEVDVTVGEDSLQEYKLILGDNLTDRLAYRFAANVRGRDGTMSHETGGDDRFNEVDKQAYRGQLFWEPTDELSIRAIGYYSLDEAAGSNPEVGFNSATALYAYASALQAATVGGAPLGTDPEDRKVAAVEETSGRLEVKGGSVQFDYELDNEISLTSITAYQEWQQSDVVEHADGTAVPLALAENPINERSYSQEFRLTSPGGETVDWVAGLFYFNSDLQRGDTDTTYLRTGTGLPALISPPDALYNTWMAFPAATPGLGGLPLLTAGEQTYWQTDFSSESVALFGQATWNITDQTSLILGLRYGEEEKEFGLQLGNYDADGTLYSVATDPVFGDGSYSGGYFWPLIFGTLNNQGAMSQQGDRKEDNVSGMLSLQHHFDEAMLYATFATGAKSGGFNGAFGAIDISDREFDTESTTNYEVGAKLDGLLDGRMRLNLAYFYTEYEDFQAATFDPQSIAFMVVNAGKQVTQGVDLEVTYLASEELTLNMSLEYLDAKYSDFEGANCHALEGGANCDQSGERMPWVANWSGSLSADYVLPLDSGDEFYARVGLSFKTDHNTSGNLAPYGEGANYEIWNARLGWRSESWDISLWGKNLTDEIHNVYSNGNVVASLFAAADNNASTLNSRHWINEPRSLGITARYSF